MSCGAMPASSQAALIASEASCNSLRPEFQENSVSPMPTIAALSLMPLVSAGMMVGAMVSYSSSQSTTFRCLKSWDLIVGIPQFPEDGAGVLPFEGSRSDPTRGIREVHHGRVPPELTIARRFHLGEESVLTHMRVFVEEGNTFPDPRP